MPSFLQFAWILGTLAEFALIARLRSNRLDRRYPAFFSFLLVSAIQVSILAWFDQRTWAYARAWAYSSWFVIVAQAAMLAEILIHLWRYFHLSDLRMVRVWLLVLTVIAAAASWWTLDIELPQVRWDKPLLVQLTMVVWRGAALAFAATALLAFVSLGWVCRIRRNLIAHTSVAAGLWVTGAIAQCGWMLGILSPEQRHFWSAAYTVVSGMAYVAWIAVLSPAGERDAVEQRPLGEAYEQARTQTERADTLMRKVRRGASAAPEQEVSC